MKRVLSHNDSKYLDVLQNSVDVTDTPTARALSSDISQGQVENERIGQVVIMKRLDFNVDITPAQPDTGSGVLINGGTRMVIVLDHQARSGAAVSWGTVFTDSTMTAFPERSEERRFEIIFDEYISYHPSSLAQFGDVTLPVVNTVAVPRHFERYSIDLHDQLMIFNGSSASDHFPRIFILMFPSNGSILTSVRTRLVFCDN